MHEAVIAYRSRAYRASVVSTWIAVTFDLISKMRELSLQGEAYAESACEELDRAIQSRDKPALQRFEDSLLERAEDQFEFLDIHQKALL